MRGHLAFSPGWKPLYGVLSSLLVLPSPPLASQILFVSPQEKQKQKQTKHCPSSSREEDLGRQGQTYSYGEEHVWSHGSGVVIEVEKVTSGTGYRDTTGYSCKNRLLRSFQGSLEKTSKSLTFKNQTDVNTNQT